MVRLAPVSAIADVLALRSLEGWLTPPLQPVVTPREPTMGRAVTIELRAEMAGTGLAPLHDLLSTDLNGAVVVIAGATGVGGAVWGEILSTAARNAGAVAVLVEGSVRDRKAMKAEGLPVYAVDERVVGPSGRVSVVAVGEPVSIADVCVAPGDVVVCDDGGALRLDPAVAESVLADACAYAAAETQVLESLVAGEPLTSAYRHKRAVLAQLRGSGGG